ncbi:hypothetical protein [Variovorax sp. OV329]|uniref:hypothetical protein n=1 Tax=Variovorax sp. OV329 TaxID=1882825 RepID=UPI0008F24A0C|nr:hypothetical protein [Variovorax sp. OV329]SFM29849.1 hypothetical protein SAMN05444747_104157 [Variovorax sp. OV329]
MTVLCGACNAENRDAAKFCKGCGRKIAQAWPQAITPLAVGAADANILLGAAAAAPVSKPAAAPASAVEEIQPVLAFERPRIGNGRWIAGLGLAVVLLVLVAAWWGHKNRSQEIAEPSSPPAAASPAPIPAAIPETELTPAATQAMAPAPTPVADGAPLIEGADASLHPAPAADAAVQKPRKQLAKKQAPATAPAPVVEAVAPMPPPPAPEPVRIPTPQEACAGRNFVARAQCMAAQCARPEVAGHAQCEAVRRQQQIEEERRNPTMSGAG